MCGSETVSHQFETVSVMTPLRVVVPHELCPGYAALDPGETTRRCSLERVQFSPFNLPNPGDSPEDAIGQRDNRTLASPKFFPRSEVINSKKLEFFPACPGVHRDDFREKTA
jgi:hypothetical protein